jgi:hypothetical protein
MPTESHGEGSEVERGLQAKYLEWEEDANMAHPSYEECDRHPA